MQSHVKTNVRKLFWHSLCIFRLKIFHPISFQYYLADYRIRYWLLMTTRRGFKDIYIIGYTCKRKIVNPKTNFLRTSNNTMIEKWVPTQQTTTPFRPRKQVWWKMQIRTIHCSKQSPRGLEVSNQAIFIWIQNYLG